MSEKMKKIMIYVNSMNASGGIERVISNLVSEWVNNYKIVIVTKDDGESFYELPESIEKIAIRRPLILDMKKRNQRIFSIFKSILSTRKKLSLILKSIEPNYVYTSNPINALEAMMAMRNPQEMLVISEHGSYYGYNKLYTWIKRAIYPKAYKISVLNRMDTEIYNKWGNNALYIPHIVTYEAIKQNQLNTKILLNVGRLTSDKQQGLLITMWSKIKEKNGWVLWIVGDGEEKEYLASKIHELELDNSVKLISAKKQIVEIYKQASFFALSSRCEGFGMVLLEVMSFGVPCISFDCLSGPRDIVVDSYNGFLVEDKNQNMYIDRLNQIVSMSQIELNKYGNRAFQTVQNWDNENILKKWNEIFK